ncbi:MAG: hypothetical protein DI538_23785, partial [Azospira oryzae]
QGVAAPGVLGVEEGFDLHIHRVEYIAQFAVAAAVGAFLTVGVDKGGRIQGCCPSGDGFSGRL